MISSWFLIARHFSTACCSAWLCGDWSEMLKPLNSVYFLMIFVCTAASLSLRKQVQNCCRSRQIVMRGWYVGDTGGLLEDDWRTPTAYKLDLIHRLCPSPSRILVRCVLKLSWPAIASCQRHRVLCIYLHGQWMSWQEWHFQTDLPRCAL